jgi:hypothetical protein
MRFSRYFSIIMILRAVRLPEKYLADTNIPASIMSREKRECFKAICKVRKPPWMQPFSTPAAAPQIKGSILFGLFGGEFT